MSQLVNVPVVKSRPSSHAFEIMACIVGIGAVSRSPDMVDKVQEMPGHFARIETGYSRCYTKHI